METRIMRVSQLRFLALAAASGIALSGCAYGMYGDPYGYSGVSVGIGSGYGYDGYGGYGYPYGGYGYGYGGYDPFGWYGDYYYPGSGIYVYDRYRSRRVWNDDQRRYWRERRERWERRTGSTTSPTTTTGENWSSWDRSRWRDRRNGTPGTMASSTGEAPRFSGAEQNRSPVTTQRQTVRNPDASPSRHSHEGKRPD
jgi:hypothetical protein